MSTLLQRVIDQVRTDFAAAHEEICKLQGLDPKAKTWPEWSSIANTLRWFDQIEAAAGVESELVEPVAWQSKKDAFHLVTSWAFENNPLLSKENYEPLYSAASLSQLQQRIAEVDDTREKWRKLCLQHEQTILDERSRAEAAEAALEAAWAAFGAAPRSPTLADHINAALDQLAGYASGARAALEAKDAKLAEAVAALEPFSAFAAENLDADDGSSWGGNRCERERIVDWFGPSDFRRARSFTSSIQEKDRG